MTRIGHMIKLVSRIETLSNLGKLWDGGEVNDLVRQAIDDYVSDIECDAESISTRWSVEDIERELMEATIVRIKSHDVSLRYGDIQNLRDSVCLVRREDKNEFGYHGFVFDFDGNRKIFHAVYVSEDPSHPIVFDIEVPYNVDKHMYSTANYGWKILSQTQSKRDLVEAIQRAVGSDDKKLEDDGKLIIGKLRAGEYISVDDLNILVDYTLRHQRAAWSFERPNINVPENFEWSCIFPDDLETKWFASVKYGHVCVHRVNYDPNLNSIIF